ncbi:MAG: hypothetical protein BGN85_11585 [Alphaproteobacteria bacterium 64-11]|nr:glycosyltransferase family 2 protein [Alphaproteobacteria bacterium]OJU08132.1 MAG: hypothetical protein BGN85_11585 [Alphaproteobacteria bacterium 64-11]
MIGVAIPFFQRKPGLLNRALRSIAVQQGDYRVHVYIIDDASPIPAEQELAGLEDRLTRDIVILRQANAGPGRARNLALDKMDADVEIVAFLDSDDAWESGHLQNICRAFAAGADFYFADHRREEDLQNRFTQCGFEPDGASIGGSDHLFWCERRGLIRAVVQRSPVGTSTVAIRRSKLGATRFPTWLRSAGEDSIFWLEVLRGDLKTACSTTMEVALGRGVSIFNHRSWGTQAALRTTLDEMRLQIHLRQHFALDDDLTAQSKAQCRRLDQAFCAHLIGCLRRMQWPGANLPLSYFRHRPGALLQLPPIAARALWQKMQPSPP